MSPVTPEHAEVGIQTGETIRLRQGMSFGEEPPEKAEDVVKERTVPLGKPDINSNFERFANNSFEKRGHPATSVLNAMLQQRQMQGDRSRVENTQSSYSASMFSRVEMTGKKEELHRPQDVVSDRSERRRSFIDNQHHQYETRTHQEWRSSTISQWEEGKLDENSNEILTSVWNQSEERLRNKSTDHLQEHKKRFSEASDQVFEEREVTERLEYQEGIRPPHVQSYTVRELREVNVGGEQPNLMTHSKVPQQELVLPVQSGNENPPQYLHEVSKTVPTIRPNVIQKETAEELRQKVLAESRPPSTPKSVRAFGFGSQATRSEIDRMSTSALATRNSVTPNTSSLFSPTSSRLYRRGYSYGRSEPGSPYKWQVPDIDIHREYREPDARSNESKLSGTGSTVRRHVPRGRIRDLARLFDKMTREAEREAAVLRGKSLPPPKHRSKFTRTRSMPRPQDLLAREEELRREDEERNRGPVLRELPISYKTNRDGVSDIQPSNSVQPVYMSVDRNSGGDAHEPVLPTYGHEWSKVPCTGLEPGMLHPNNDDKESTDSRVDLRRTSTPLGNHGEGDLVNAFGRVPSIPSPEHSAVYDGRRPESVVMRNTNYVGLEKAQDAHAAEPSMPSAPTEHHYAKPVIVKPAPPPQRLSVLHPNTSQHGYYRQLRRVSSEQQYRSYGEPHPQTVASPLTRERRFTNSEEEKVNGEIDRMFEFVEEHDGLSTIGHRTLSDRTSAVIRPDGYGTVRGEGVDHISELPPQPPQPPVLPPGDGAAAHRVAHPLKYSVSGYRDMQRSHRVGYVPSDTPPRFSPLTAPTPGVGVSTYKSREGTIGEKVSTYGQFSRNTTQHPSALATSTPVDSPVGTGFSQGTNAVPNFDDSFLSAITTGTHPRDAHEEYKRQMTKLNHQIRVQEEQIEMTLKVLALARKKQKSMQELSAQRTLLLARERLDLLRCEVSRISALAAVRNPPPPVSRELRGTMTISNICVYLNRSFCQRQYEQESSYALLILLKCGAEVEATGPVSLLAHNQNRIRQLTFAESVQFSNLPVDFNVVLEVYAMKLPSAKNVEQSCASNIANKCKNLLSPALAHRSNRPSQQESGGSEFVRCGYIILNRDTVGMNKFYLDEAEYPLEGTIEVFARCTTLPPAIEVDNRGFLTMYQTISGMGSWERYWAVLRRGMVYFWRYPDDESMEKRPVAFMDLSKCTNDVVTICTPEQCPRENSFSIDMLVSTTPSLMEKKRVLLSADSEDLLHAWLQALNETLSVLRG
ncbi:PH domain protein [Ancylostoma duodenale]|uniref:PH domain protein n=1 Tax=Ancylostoma duodenale TaxID=51022 RepID=A0A0C2DQF4_9BILA|nr:PH domain protein [Ancylostoma duodenale]